MVTSTEHERSKIIWNGLAGTWNKLAALVLVSIFLGLAFASLVNSIKWSVWIMIVLESALSFQLILLLASGQIDFHVLNFRQIRGRIVMILAFLSYHVFVTLSR